MQKENRLYRLVALAMLAAVSYVLMLLNFPLPAFPPYLKMDFSDIPALIGALLFGPAAGIIIEAVKNLLHYVTQPGPAGVPIGELANFVAGLLLILPVALLARRIGSSKKRVIAGILAGVVLMAVVMSILNYFVLLPAYMWFLHFPHMTSDAMVKLVTVAILPFNLIKGALTGVVFLVLYPKLKPLIQRYQPKKKLRAV
ncbi:MAG TPA: ECF transporter S component [Bacillales bacterium]|nr:ECF transporter S component [Bacillales bacterium]